MLHPGEQQQHQQQHQLRQQQQQPSEIIMVPIMPHASNQSTATMTSTASSGGSDAGILFTDSSSSHSSNANRGSAIITGAQLAETIDHYAMHQGPLQHLPVHQQPLLFPLPSTGIQRSQSAVALHETVYTEIQQLASVGEAQDYIRNHLARWIMYHGQLRMIRDENGNIFAGLMRDPANVAMDLNLNTQISHMYAELDVLASNFLTAAAAGGVGQAEEDAANYPQRF
ncbi:hypothetical protein GQ42DRAFT_170159 [Ramicandelaber brevisporus]|nr:hypothetical protein GQ42DRAFT_170159 [Ramicandelaber brevisporus]